MYETQNIWKSSTRLVWYKVGSIPIAWECLKIHFNGKQQNNLYQQLQYIRACIQTEVVVNISAITQVHMLHTSDGFIKRQPTKHPFYKLLVTLTVLFKSFFIHMLYSKITVSLHMQNTYCHHHDVCQLSSTSFVLPD